MSWPWMRTDPESGCFEADDEPQQYALAGAAASQHGQGFSAAHAQTDPVQNLVAAEGLVQVLDGDNRRTAVLLRFRLLHRNVIGCGHVCLRLPRIAGYGKTTRMNFTSTTSARIRKSEPSTTELVAARPTPSAPPRVRIP